MGNLNLTDFEAFTGKFIYDLAKAIENNSAAELLAWRGELKQVKRLGGKETFNILSLILDTIIDIIDQRVKAQSRIKCLAPDAKEWHTFGMKSKNEGWKSACAPD